MRKYCSSFRDPSGTVVEKGGYVIREVNKCYSQEYRYFMDSGLYDELAMGGLIVTHQELKDDHEEHVFKLLKPQMIPFISYPYEWCFNQLKEAALLTLDIQRRALNFGMILKDASAYNVQFIGSTPIFIDTLSFEKYHEGQPWIAYRQFCQHFLAPLALYAYKDLHPKILQMNLDGMPLDLTSRLLPWKTNLNLGLLTHIHTHARFQNKYSEKSISKQKLENLKVSSQSIRGLIDNLGSLIGSMSYKSTGAWDNYYLEKCSYTDKAIKDKMEIVTQFVEFVGGETIWDCGSNTGLFSRLVASMSKNVISMDFDPASVEHNFLECKKTKSDRVLPLINDMTNPSPDIGWGLKERRSIISRGPADLLMALALIHHLVIGNNVPMQMVAEYFASIGKFLIIEFVPREDPMVQKMLAVRHDIFSDYNEDSFQKYFSKYYDIIEVRALEDSPRTIYLMKKIG